MSSLY